MIQGLEKTFTTEAPSRCATPRKNKKNPVRRKEELRDEEKEKGGGRRENKKGGLMLREAFSADQCRLLRFRPLEHTEVFSEPPGMDSRRAVKGSSR
jgi:hypothetical protein